MTATAATDPIAQRFADLIEQFGLTKNAFAVSLGKTASVVQHLVDGRNKPGFDLLCKIFEIYPNVSRDWLLLGQGPMLVSGTPAPRPAEKAPEPPQPSPKTADSAATSAAAPGAAPEAAPEFEPIDLSDLASGSPRRTGTRLQPEEILATLALAAAAQHPRPVTAVAAPPAAARTAPPETYQVAAESETTPAYHRTENQAATAVSAAAAPAPEASAGPVPLPVPPAATTPPATVPTASAAPAAPEAFALLLQTQQLQHQLALAELRNQHLLEQQQMLREMLAMTRG